LGLVFEEAVMQGEQNIAMALSYYEECANEYGDPEKTRAIDAVDRLLSDDFAMYYNSETDEQARRGRETHKQFLLRHTRSFPGERWAIDLAVADRETVACQWRIRATDAKTGNPIDLRAADFFGVRDGRLAVLRRFLNFGDLEKQRAPR